MPAQFTVKVSVTDNQGREVFAARLQAPYSSVFAADTATPELHPIANFLLSAADNL